MAALRLSIRLAPSVVPEFVGLRAADLNIVPSNPHAGITAGASGGPSAADTIANESCLQKRWFLVVWRLQWTLELRKSADLERP